MPPWSPPCCLKCDSPLCSVAQPSVCFQVPSCSSLRAFPVPRQLWRSLNGSGGAYLSKHSSQSTLEKGLVLSLLAGHTPFDFWNSGISLLAGPLWNRGGRGGEALEQLSGRQPPRLRSQLHSSLEALAKSVFDLSLPPSSVVCKSCIGQRDSTEIGDGCGWLFWQMESGIRSFNQAFVQSEKKEKSLEFSVLLTLSK